MNCAPIQLSATPETMSPISRSGSKSAACAEPKPASRPPKASAESVLYIVKPLFDACFDQKTTRSPAIQPSTQAGAGAFF